MVLVVALLIGFFQGKKRGMSEELLDLFKWLVIVVVSALAYPIVGNWLTRFTPINQLWGSIISYVAIAVALAAVFGWIKTAMGKKIVGSDVFGGMEYYLGALSGMMRAFCIVFVLISILNAKHVSDERRERLAKVQKENFGAISFPTIGSLQRDVFSKSFSGPYIQRYMGGHLMRPVQMADKERSTITTQRENTIDNIIKKK